MQISLLISAVVERSLDSIITVSVNDIQSEYSASHRIATKFPNEN